jgi:hypothetical protein
MTQRETALRCNYELYHSVPGYKAAARKIDAAVGRAARKVPPLVRRGLTLQEAMESALTECVKPVMGATSKWGSGDTEPEWHAVDVLMELVEKQLGVKLEGIDGWSLRFSL